MVKQSHILCYVFGTPDELRNIFKNRSEIPPAREQDSNLRPTDSKSRMLKIQNCCDFKRLILQRFFN